MPRLTSRSRSVRDKVVVVTGAASGMGRAIAHLFADEGARVAVTDRDARGVDAVAGEIVAAGAFATGWTLDVSDPDGDRPRRRRGRAPDSVPSTSWSTTPASRSRSRSAADDFEAAWATTLAVNLTAQARMVRACLPYLERDRRRTRREHRLDRRARCNPLHQPVHRRASTASIGLTRSLAVRARPAAV